jgi:hypothetical protein
VALPGMQIKVGDESAQSEKSGYMDEVRGGLREFEEFLVTYETESTSQLEAMTKMLQNLKSKQSSSQVTVLAKNRFAN